MNAFFFRNQTTFFYIQIEKNMEIFFSDKEEKESWIKAKLKTELPVDVAKCICHFYVEIHENLSAYYSEQSIFQHSKNNPTWLKICVIFTRSMKKYGSRGLKKHNHKAKSYFRKFYSLFFPLQQITFHSNFSHENSTFFQ